jgi:MFS family permease
MLGWWGTFMPLGAMLALLLGPWWMGLVGWQGLWLALGVLTLGVALRLWLLLPADVGAQPGKEASKDQTGAEDWWLRLSQTLTQAGPWLVAGCFAVYSCQWMAVIGFLPTIYLQAGYSTDSTALLTALVAGSNMLGNVASGWLLGRGVAARRVLWMGYGAMGLGTVGAFSGVLGGLQLEMELVGRFVSVVLFSAVGGVVPGTLDTLAVRVAPNERTISTTVGWMQQWSALGQFSGAPLVAATAAYMGGWHWTWCVTAVCASIGLVLAWRLGQRGQA